MGEENINNSGCDQFTRPEEILELQKYLRAIKEDLAERTELGTDVVRMDSSYRAGEINLDRNLSSTGRVATNMNSESERIDFSNAILGIPLEGVPGEVKLETEIEKVNQEGQKSINKLPDTIDTINVERIERLEKVREKLVGADTNSPRELETYVEKLDVALERINLGNELEKIIGETKEINLSQERVDLVEPKFIDSLGTEKEKIKGEIPEITLEEGRDRIPFLETKVNELSNYKESLETNQGVVIDKLDDSKIILPNIESSNEISLSNFLDTIKGENDEPLKLKETLESDGYIPEELKNINELPKELTEEEKINGDINTSISLDTFISDQGIVSGDIINTDNLQTQLSEDSYIKGELKNPNLQTQLSEDSYIKGELKNPNLQTQLPENSYIEGELKNLNLTKELPEDSYIEGELKNLNLTKELPEDSYVEGELKSPNLHDNLPENGYVEGELKNPNLSEELPEDSYIKGELKNPNLTKELPEDSYIEGELKNLNLTKELPENSYIEGELKNLNLQTQLPEDSYVEGELKNLNLNYDYSSIPKDRGKMFGEEEDLPDAVLGIPGEIDKVSNFSTKLPEDGYTGGEFENIDELQIELPKDGHTKGEFGDIDELHTKLPKDGKTKGEFEDIDRLANKLPKKDGKVRGEFEDIDKLSRKLPKKDGYTRGDFKKIKELTEELPYPDGYPDGDFKEVGKLTKKLPADGYVDGKFVDLGEELPEDLPEGGLIEGDFKKLPEELTKELPEGGTIDKEDLVKIKSLPEELSPDGKIDEEDLVEIKRLPKNIAPDGKIEGEPYEIERLTKKLSKDDKADGDFVEIDRLKKTLPKGGKIEGKSKSINELPNEIEDGGLIQGDFKKLGDLSKEIPIGGLIEGNFKKPIPSNKLPKDGKLDEEDLIKIKKLSKDLPKDGHIGEEGIIELQKLPEDLSKDGHIGEEGIVQLKKLPEDLPKDGHIGEEGIIEFQNLPKELTEDGISGGDRKDIRELDSFFSDDGFIEGDFKELNLSDVLPNPDGYTQGDLIDISELDKVLSDDGLIHGGNEGPFTEEAETENLFQRYSSNDEMFSIIDGTIPSSALPLGDDWEHTTPEDKFRQYTGKLGGIYVDPVTREVRYEGSFQISNGTIAKDTFSTSDPEGEEGLRRRRDIELDNSEFDEIGGLIPKSTIPRADDWQHRDGDQLDNKKFDEIDGLIPDSTIPEGDDWEHLDPIDKINFYNKSKIREKSVDPSTKEREYKGEFSIEEGIVPDSEIPKGDIWEHEDFEKQFKLYEDSAVRIESVDAEGNIKYKGEFKFDEGVIPKNSRPKGEEDKDPKLYEWLRSLEKIDSGAGDLYHALLKRAGHDLEGYYKYLVNYAENKDLDSGWGKKLSSALSEVNIGSGNSITLDVYKQFEDKLFTGVVDYYNHEGKIRLEQSHLPRGLDAYMSSSGYLRYMADLVRSGYNLLEKKGGRFWGNMQGALGLKEIMLDTILMELVKLRDKGERASKSNRDRLPGGTGILQEMIMDLDVWKTATSLGRTFIDKFRSNRKGSTHGDTTNPINRPIPDEISYDPNYISYDNFGNNTSTKGWYDPHAMITTENGKTSLGKKKMSVGDAFKSAIKDTFSKSGNEKLNYKFNENYLQGAGIRVTLYDLADHDLDNPNEKYHIDTVEDFMNVVRWSPLISEPSKFLFVKDPNSSRNITTTLDTNNYWEVIIEPYLGVDNGYCSYLPKIEEINVINEYTHGYKTFYSKWVPIVSFDLSRSKTTTKSIGLFGGEFTIPGGIEYSNELRITILDDVYKSWRKYFEKCADVGVYNSRIHDRDFYIDPNLSKNEIITVVDKTNFALAPYKNVTFRVRIYIMTPQYSTINKYDLLATLKDVSIERAGEVDPGSQDLELTFSIVGETNEDYLAYPYIPKENKSEVTEEGEEDSLELFKKQEDDLFIKNNKSNNTVSTQTIESQGSKKKKKG